MPLNKCFPCLQFQNDEVITKLDCSNTMLTEVFPNVWQYERTLEELYLTSTRINTLPPQLFYCQSLRILVVNSNNLESVPNAIGSLRQLQHLNLSRNLISNVPENIKACKNLTHLDLSCNNLQRLPDAISSLISLRELLLNETYLEFLPANFGRLVNLKILELRLNNLITLPKSMARLCNLQRIDIGGNEFTELPEVIGELKQLRELWIDFNQIRRISPNVVQLRELQHFEANGNLIEALPNEISHWPNVEVLSLCANNLELLPTSVGMLKYLVTLKCESCELHELPDSFSHLESLEELVVSHNQLQRLPATIGMLRKLRFLFADGNELQTLPPELCSCSSMSVLSVSRNRLTELPQQIGHLSQLKVLNLVQNHIATLPVSVLSLVNLTSLWISDNQSQPLVPLQYVDINTKTQLTCFMLPQVDRPQEQPHFHGHHIKVETELEKGYEAYEYDVNSKVDERKNTRTQSNSPIRRICFAEEATILTPGAAVSTSSVVEQQQQILGVRLMRSPTPYPKELRLMAKYVRNGQKFSQQQPAKSHDAETTENVPFKDIKEARVLLNTSTLTAAATLNDCDTNNSFNNEVKVAPLHVQQQQLQQKPQKYADDFLLQQSQSFSSELYSSMQQQTLYATQQPFGQTSQMSPQQQEQLMYAQAYFITAPLLQQPATTSMSATALHGYGFQQDQQPFLPDYYSQASNYLAAKQQTQKQQFADPPPYHIARVFTKKTPEDLTRYETVQKQQQQMLRQQQTADNFPDAAETNSNCEAGLMNLCLEATTNLDAQNNFVLDAADSLKNQLLQKPAYVESSHAQLSIASGVGGSAPITTTDSSDSQTGAISTVSSTSGKRTPWLFGVHKNPTVKQISLKWEQHIGFEIDEIPHMEGIYITSTAPQTPAARLLYAHDKLLEIDGYDFTNVPLHEAKRILMNVGPVLQIMLSRN